MLIEGKQELDKAKITVVASRYNNFVVERLLEACLNTLKKSGLQDQDIIARYMESMVADKD